MPLIGQVLEGLAAVAFRVAQHTSPTTEASICGAFSSTKTVNEAPRACLEATDCSETKLSGTSSTARNFSRHY